MNLRRIKIRFLAAILLFGGLIYLKPTSSTQALRRDDCSSLRWEQPFKRRGLRSQCFGMPIFHASNFDHGQLRAGHSSSRPRPSDEGRGRPLPPPPKDRWEAIPMPVQWSTLKSVLI